MSEAESKRSARIEYARCRQQNGEYLLDFYDRFRQAVHIIQVVGEVEPSEETKSVDFLESLDKRVYGKMMRDLKNRVRNGQLFTLVLLLVLMVMLRTIFLRMFVKLMLVADVSFIFDVWPTICGDVISAI